MVAVICAVPDFISTLIDWTKVMHALPKLDAGHRQKTSCIEYCASSGRVDSDIKS
jgi:hypothetical protein